MYDILEPDNGPNGIKLAEDHTNLSLIICDFNMPGGLNGLETIEKIRDIDHHKETPIYMLTTESNSLMKNRGKELGLKAWVVKPCSDERLKSVTQKIVAA
ncbi:MAG: response regulator [Oligoflexales bacterium]|nr:response regulator [Oligoflexales bacterium]